MPSLFQEQPDNILSNLDFTYCNEVESNINIEDKHFTKGTDTAFIDIYNQNCFNNLDIFNTRANDIVIRVYGDAFQFSNKITIESKPAKLTVFSVKTDLIFKDIQTTNVLEFYVFNAYEPHDMKTIIDGMNTDIFSIGARSAFIKGSTVAKGISIVIHGSNVNNYSLYMDNLASLTSTNLRIINSNLLKEKVDEFYGPYLSGNITINGFSEIISSQNIFFNGTFKSHSAKLLAVGNINNNNITLIKDDLNVTANNINLSDSSRITSDYGAINLGAATVLSNYGEISAKNDLNILAGNVHLYNLSKITSGSGNIKIKTESYKFNDDISGEIISPKGEIKIEGVGTINLINSVILSKNDSIIESRGYYIIQINSDESNHKYLISSKEGSVVLKARDSLYLRNSKIEAANDVILEGDYKGLNISGKLEITDSVRIFSSKIISHRNLEITGKYIVKLTNNIITAKQDINVKGKNSSIILEDNAMLGSEEGNVLLNSLNTITQSNTTVQAKNNIEYSTNGLIKLDSITAKVVSSDGNIAINGNSTIIDGELVSLNGRINIDGAGYVTIGNGSLISKGDIDISTNGSMLASDDYSILSEKGKVKLHASGFIFLEPGEIKALNVFFEAMNDNQDSNGSIQFHGNKIISYGEIIISAKSSIYLKGSSIASKQNIVFESKQHLISLESAPDIAQKQYLIISEEGSIIFKAFNGIIQESGKTQAKKDIVHKSASKKSESEIKFLEDSQVLSIDGKIIIETSSDVEVKGRLEGSIDIKANKIRVNGGGSIITNNKDVKIDIEWCHKKDECLQNLPSNTLGNLEIAINKYIPSDYIINTPQIVGGQYKLRIDSDNQVNIYFNKDAFIKAGSIVIESYNGNKVRSVNINGGQIEASNSYATNSIKTLYFKLSPTDYKKWYEFNSNIGTLDCCFDDVAYMLQQYKDHVIRMKGVTKNGDFNFASQLALQGRSWGILGTLEYYVGTVAAGDHYPYAISGMGVKEKKYYHVRHTKWQECEYDGKYSINDPAKFIVSGDLNIDASEIENKLSFVVVYKTLQFMGKPNINIFSDSVVRWEWQHSHEVRHGENYGTHIYKCISKPISTVSSVIHAGQLTGEASNIKIGRITTGSHIPQIGYGNSNAVERANDINNVLHGHKIQPPLTPFGDVESLNPQQIAQALYYKQIRDNYFRTSGYDVRHSISGITLNPNIWRVDISLDKLLNSNANDNDLTIYPMVNFNNIIARDIDSTYIIKQMLTNLGYKGKGILPTIGDVFYIQSLVQTAMLQHIGLIEGLDYANIVTQLLSNTEAEYKRLGLTSVAFPSNQIANLNKPILAPLIIEQCIGNLPCLSFELFVNAQSANTIKQDRALSADNTIDLDVSGKVIVDSLNTISAGGAIKVSAGEGVLMLGRAEAPIQDWNTTVFINAGEVVTAQSLVVSAVNMLITGSITGEGNVTLKAVENIVMTAMIKTLQSSGWSSSYFYTKVESQADINIGGTLRLEAGRDIYNVASRMVGNKVELIAGGNTYVVSLDIYNQMSVWGKKYFYSYKELKQLQPVIQATNGTVYIQSAQETFLRAPIIIAKDDGIFVSGSFKELAADEYVEVVVKKKKSRGGLSGLLGGDKTRTTKDYNSTPALAYFYVGQTLHTQTHDDQVWQSPQIVAHDMRLVAGTPEHAAHITFFNAYNIKHIEVHTQKTGFDIKFKDGGIKYTFKQKGKNVNTEAQVIPSIIQLGGSFQGYASGDVVMLSANIDARNGKIIINATNIDLGVAPDLKYSYAFIDETGVGIGFSEKEGEFALKAGVFQNRESHTRAEASHTQTAFNANHIEFNAKETLQYSGIIINAQTFKEKAEIIIKGFAKDTVEEKHFKSQMSAGVKFGIKTNWGAIMQGSQKLANLKPTQAEDIITGYFTAIEFITNVAQLLSGQAFSGGLWAYFEYQKDSSKSTVINAVPVFINVTGDAHTTADEATFIGLQMKAYNYYLNVNKLNVSPAQNTAEYESNSQSIDVSIPIKGSVTPSMSAMMAQGKGSQTVNLNTNIYVSGRLTMNIEGHADIKGAYIDAGSIEANFNSLLLESVADILSDESISVGFNLGAGGINKIGLESLGAHGELNKHKRNMIGQMTAIIGRESVNIVVANTLKLVGAMIANAEKNEDGTYTDHGNLTIQTAELFVYHIKEHDDGITLGAAASILQKANDDAQNQKSQNDESKEKGKVEYQDKFKFAGHKINGQTDATIGRGTIKVEKGDSSNIKDLNRDVNNAQKRNTEYDIKPVEFQSPKSTLNSIERMNRALEPFKGDKKLWDTVKGGAKEALQKAFGWSTDIFATPTPSPAPILTPQQEQTEPPKDDQSYDSDTEDHANMEGDGYETDQGITDEFEEWTEGDDDEDLEQEKHKDKDQKSKQKENNKGKQKTQKPKSDGKDQPANDNDGNKAANDNGKLKDDQYGPPSPEQHAKQQKQSADTISLTEAQKQDAQAKYEEIVKDKLADVKVNPKDLACFGGAICFAKQSNGQKEESVGTILGRKLKEAEDEFGVYMKANYPKMHTTGKALGIVFDSTMGLVGDSVAVSYIALRALERLVLPESVISGQEDVFKAVLKEFKSATTPEERYLYGRLMDAAGAATIAKMGITAAIGKVANAKTILKQSFAKGEMSKTSYETAAKNLDNLHHTYTKEIYNKFPNVDKNIVNQNVERVQDYLKRASDNHLNVVTDDISKLTESQKLLIERSLDKNTMLEAAVNELSKLTELQKLSATKAIEEQALKIGKVNFANSKTKKVFEKANIYVEKYGGAIEDYVKTSSESYKASNKLRIETHWVENIKTGARYDVKPKIYILK